MSDKNELSPAFGRASHPAGEPDEPYVPTEEEKIKQKRQDEYQSFSQWIDFFKDDTPQQILNVLQNLGLPPPSDNKEFMTGWEGGLIFLNQYGLVIRIDQKEFGRSNRIDSSPWIVRPIASIDAGEVVIEICPGSHQEDDPQKLKLVAERLETQNINLWDYKLSNVGRLPIKTRRFPEGITVVIDRGGVEWMQRRKPILKALLKAKEMRKAMKAQDEFYAPLRQAFAEAYPDAGKMQKFWQLCEEFAQQGKLPAGWNEPQPAAAAQEKPRHGNNVKTLAVPEIAKRYETRLKAASPRPPRRT